MSAGMKAGMLAGARDGAMSGVRRLVASAMARDLTVFVLPSPAVARALGLDLAHSDLRIVGTPRHAGVLLIVGPLHPGLQDAAAVAYAQMPRPRAILALGADDIAPLPDADVLAPLSQAGLKSGLAGLRAAIAAGAFRTDATDFTASALAVRVEYTCPMHPEVVSDAPGNCPKCGMTLMPRETTAGAHAGHAGGGHGGGGDHGGHSGHASHAEHHGHAADNNHADHDSDAAEATYTCPMHPEVVSKDPGSCPKCGMFLVKAGGEATHGHDHGHEHEHGQAQHDDHAGHSNHIDHTRHGDHASHADHGSHTDHAGHSGHASHQGHSATPEPESAAYTCPMHPEVVSDAPGSCPKCGMFLVKAASEADHGHGHGHESESAHAGHGAHAAHTDHATHEPEAAEATYTCPMHPEVVSDAPGSCPKCGMFLVRAGGEATHGHDHGHEHEHGQAQHDEHAGHGGDNGHASHAGQGDHTGHGGHEAHAGHDAHAGHGGASADQIDGIEPHFMSMAALTKDQPRSSDGLQMDWIEVPFGPVFPGLPAGLHLSLTLDGDTVAGSVATSLVGIADLLNGANMTPAEFADRLAAMMPLSPVAYRALVCAAVEDAAGIAPSADQRRSRAAAIERERIASHLGWLAEFGTQSGFVWLAERAGALQIAVQRADVAGIAGLAPSIRRLLSRLMRTPLLRMRLGGRARIGADIPASGPIDRARGGRSDARAGDATLAALGFETLSREGGDALARLHQRCDEIAQSIGLIAAAGGMALPETPDIGAASGDGRATVETPRGAARLQVKLTDGRVTEARLDAPSLQHLALIEALCAQQELGDALVAVGSLDLSPWEIRA